MGVWIESSSLNGWSARVINTEQTSYEPLKDYINGHPVSNLHDCFLDCKYMSVAPEIPNTVKNMTCTFSQCSSLIETPEIPESAEIIYATFHTCTGLTDLPQLPDSATDTFATFINCTSLTGIMEINCNPPSYDRMFEGTVKDIYLTGSSIYLSAMAETDTNDNVHIFVANNTIPVGAVYYRGIPRVEGSHETVSGFDAAKTGVTSGATQIWTAGQEFPTPQNGDRLIYDGYEYAYNCYAWGNYTSMYWYDDGNRNGWGVRATDINKAHYGMFLTEIANKPIFSLVSTFEDCRYMTSISEYFFIPETVYSTNQMFDECSAITELPETLLLPEDIYITAGMFWECYSLKKLPENFVIPESVVNISYMFAACSSLSDIIEFNMQQDVLVYDYCFQNTVHDICVVGSSPWLFEIANTDTNDNVHMLEYDKIPDGAIYYRGLQYNILGNEPYNAKVGVFSGATTSYTADQTMPTPVTGDRFVCGEYEYVYNCYAYNGVGSTGYDLHWFADTSMNGWGVRVINPDATNFGMILTKIAGKPVKRLTSTFEDCFSLVSLTDHFFVPETITDMEQMFDNCPALTKLPVNFTVPDSVVKTYGMCWECTSLTSLPENFAVGKNVTDITYMFDLCSNLTGTLTINSTPTKYAEAISGTQISAINGSCSDSVKKAIMATK